MTASLCIKHCTFGNFDWIVSDDRNLSSAIYTIQKGDPPYSFKEGDHGIFIDFERKEVSIIGLYIVKADCENQSNGL